MKMRKISLAAIGVMLLAGAFMGMKASASALFVANENGTSVVKKGQTVDGSAYLAGNTVLVEGTVKGDVYCAGNSVRVEGTVDGDVLCAGNTVTVGGTVNGDVRAAGATVNLKGNISGNATVAGANVTTEESSVLSGDLTGGADQLSINGRVGRDMTAGATTLSVDGTIGRDIMSGFKTASFADTAKVGGNFVYYAPERTVVPTGVVQGTTKFHYKQQDQSNQGGSLLLGIGLAIAMALLVIVATAIFPRQVHNIGNVSWGMFGIAIALGLAFVIFLPIVALVLLITGFGALIAYVVMLAWLLVMALSPVGFAYFVGTKVYGANTIQVVVRAVVGALLLFIALLIPVLNILVFMVMLFEGCSFVLARLPKLYQGKLYQVTETVKAKKKKESA